MLVTYIIIGALVAAFGCTDVKKAGVDKEISPHVLSLTWVFFVITVAALWPVFAFFIIKDFIKAYRNAS